MFACVSVNIGCHIYGCLGCVLLSHYNIVCYVMSMYAVFLQSRLLSVLVWSTDERGSVFSSYLAAWNQSCPSTA